MFRLYTRKRVIRIERFMKKRDSSFDFMHIGEDPWEAVDDDL